MNVNGVNVCFGKVVRLTIKNSSDSCVLLYAPEMNELYCANIEAKVTQLLMPQMTDGRSDYTAEFTVINPPAKVLEILGKSTGYANVSKIDGLKKSKSQAFEAYWKTRPTATLDVGYWNYETDDVTKLPAMERLFHGAINTTVLTHKNTDDVLKFACSRFGEAVLDQAVGAYEQSLLTYEERKAEQENLQKEYSEKKLGSQDVSWDTKAKSLIGDFLDSYIDTTQGDTQETLAFVNNLIKGDSNRTDSEQNDSGREVAVVTKEQREYLKKHIDVAYWTADPKSNGSQYNEPLNKKAVKFPTTGFNTTQTTLEGMLNDLDDFNGMKVTHKLNYETNKQGNIVLDVWPKGSGTVRTSSGDGKAIEIVNYQNLLEVPSVGANGALVVKMMLNIKCEPGNRLKLTLDPNQGDLSGTANSFTTKPGNISNPAASRYRVSADLQGALNAFFGQFQMGKSANIYSQEVPARSAAERGYIFNHAWPINRAVHHIQTHGNAWHTEVRTVPSWNGVKVK